MADNPLDGFNLGDIRNDHPDAGPPPQIRFPELPDPPKIDFTAENQVGPPPQIRFPELPDTPKIDFTAANQAQQFARLLHLAPDEIRWTADGGVTLSVAQSEALLTLIRLWSGARGSSE